MRIGLVEAIALRMREVDRTSAPCAHCGEPVAGAYAEVFEERSFNGPGGRYVGSTAVVEKLCYACGNLHQDWIARGRIQVERDPDGQLTKGWLVHVTLRGHMFDPDPEPAAPTWTPETLEAYAHDRYRVRAGSSLPFVCLRLDGWQVGDRYCMTADEACEVLNNRRAEPVTGGRFKRGSGEAGHDGLDMAGVELAEESTC